MAFGSKAELTTEITDLLNRGDVADKVPSWLALVEAELVRILRGRPMRIAVPVLFGTTGSFELPDDMIEPVSLTVETASFRGPIDITTYERLQQRIQQLGGGGIGRPVAAAVVGSNLVFNPTDSDTAYTGTFVYDAQFLPLATAADDATNWILQQHPDLYFYGAAFHSAPFLKDDARIPTWGAIFEKIVDQIRVLRDRAEFGANTLVVKPRSALGGC